MSAAPRITFADSEALAAYVKAEVDKALAARPDRAAQVAISLDEARAASGLSAPCGRTFISQNGLDGHISWSKGRCVAGLTGHGHGPR